MFRVRRLTPQRLLLVATASVLGTLLLLTPRTIVTDIRNDPGESEHELLWGTISMGQSFVPTREGLTAVAVAVHPVQSPDTTVELQIQRAPNAERLLQLRGPLKQFLTPEGDALRFSFRPLRGVREKPLVLTLTAPEAHRDQAVPIRFQIGSEWYPRGERFRNARPRPGDLGFTTWARGGLAESWRHRFLVGRAGQGAAGGALAILGVLLLLELRLETGRDPRQPRRLAALGSLFLALLYTFPLYARLGSWAADQSDWPELVSAISATRQTLAAGEFPGWNPYICGGTPNLANPQAYVPSPAFLLSFPFGEIVGPKLAATAVLALGLLGMFFLARTLGFRGLPAVLSSAIFILSGFTTTHLAAGQWLWLTLAWVPWILVGFLRSTKTSRWWTLVAAAFLVLTLTEGRVYLVAYAGMALAVLAAVLSVQQRSVRPLINLALVGALTVLGGAWKLLPTLNFLAESETSLPNTDGVPWMALDEAFLRADVTPGVSDLFDRGEIPRHEYAAYVGVTTLLLALASLHRTVRTCALPFWIIGGVFLLLATQTADRSLLEHLPLLQELRNPSRMLSIVVLSLALLAGFGLTTVQNFLARRPGTRRTAPLVSALLVAATLSSLLQVGWRQLSRLFEAPPDRYAFNQPGFFQTNEPYQRQVNNGYPAVSEGKGAQDFCPVVLRAYRPYHRVRAREDPEYRGEIYAKGSGRAELVRWSPNRLEVLVDAPTGDTVVVNQQYSRGWSAGPFETKDDDTLLAVDLPPGRHRVRLRYRTPGLLTGSLVTLGTLVGLGLLWRIRGPRPRPQARPSGTEG